MMASEAHPELLRPPLQPGALYAALLFRGDYTVWDWAFFVPDASKTPIGTAGALFHVPDAPEPGAISRWEVQMNDTVNFYTGTDCVAMVRLADLQGLGSFGDVVQALMSTFKTIDTGSIYPAELSSRLWFIEAICMLNDCGFVTCDDVWLLERELKRYAFSAMDTYLEARGYQLHKSEHCS